MSPTPSAASPTIRLRSARDVLAAVPYLLGYRPSECVVVAGVAADGRMPLLARAALDDLADRDDGERMVLALESGCTDVGVDRAVIAICTARDIGHDTPLRRGIALLVGRLGERLDTDPWVVTPTGYRGLDCTDAACCPPGGHPLEPLETGEVSAAFVLSGRVVAATEAEAFGVPRAPEAVRALAARAASRWERAGASAEPGTVAHRRWRCEGLGTWEQALRHAGTDLQAGDPTVPVRLPPALVGRVAAALASTAVRDAVLLTLVPGGRQAARATVEGGPDARSGAPTADAIARVVDPRVAVLPDVRVVVPAQAVLETVVGHVPRRHQPPALTLLGFLAWWSGEGGLARRRIEEALELDPSYRLAVLVRGALTAGLPPGWVRRAADRAQEVPDRADTRTADPEVG